MFVIHLSWEASLGGHMDISVDVSIVIANAGCTDLPRDIAIDMSFAELIDMSINTSMDISTDLFSSQLQQGLQLNSSLLLR